MGMVDKRFDMRDFISGLLFVGLPAMASGAVLLCLCYALTAQLLFSFISAAAAVVCIGCFLRLTANKP